MEVAHEGIERRVGPLRLLDPVCAVQDAAANDHEVVAAPAHRELSGEALRA
jgi:hypothetical protein